MPMPLRPGGDSKRKAHFADAASGTAKRLKARRDARDILTQPADAALNNGALDLSAFLATRQFEISALEESMRLSKASRSQRAFQRVPRALRRRTASHNCARVPKRLRLRALREMLEDNTPRVTARRRKPRTTRARIRAEMAKKLPKLAAKRRRRKAPKEASAAATTTTVTAKVDSDGDIAIPSASATATSDKPSSSHSLKPRRPKIRRNALNSPLVPRSKFRKRQATKTWLPTHIWHAKRARMSDPKQPLWRFAIPLRPNEKLFRATHRTLTDHGAMAWDTSYMSTIGLYGRCEGVGRVLRKIGLTAEGLWTDAGRRWRAGLRTWTGMLTKPLGDAVKEICPATVMWNPASPGRPGPDAQVFIRVHPAAFEELFAVLLTHRRMETPKVYIEDLRYEIGSIEITGPAAIEALLSTLKLYHPKSKAGSHARVFSQLVGLTNPGALPAGAVLGFDVADARLYYPPKMVSPPFSSDALMDTLEHWNHTTESNLQPYRLWDRDARHTASCLPTKKAIDRRKSTHTPGQPLPHTPSDPSIPILLLSSRSGSGTRATGSFSLLLPWSYVQPLWYSLMHVPLSSGATPRFGGLRETAQVHDERHTPLFPRDFPGTTAGAQAERDMRVQREREWHKRPSGKRTAWSAINLGAGRRGEVGSPYACDYELLFDGPVHGPPPAERGVFSLEKLVAVDARRMLAGANLPVLGVVRVRITFFSQGIAHPTARVYRLPAAPSEAPSSSDVEVSASQPPGLPLPSNLREQWLALVRPHTASKPAARRTLCIPPNSLETKKQTIAAHIMHGPVRPMHVPPANTDSVNGHPLCPDVADLLGFVTSGGYSLTCGKATAIATLRADLALRDVKAAREARSKKLEKEAFLCIVRNVGHEVAWLARWEVME
ncbi:hypothetical protein TD95_000818 [Thielaviopsis punctulata]|uniref:Pop1 N-terminal domain-containing protein n=1 Tax=Thielaviopsis punctulata TaxID=72032 RepID=A0A0F4ZL30_9PEZI|nr:hypothetical protein TD95_000818 [Thielaviopsis punctulata]